MNETKFYINIYYYKFSKKKYGIKLSRSQSIKIINKELEKHFQKVTISHTRVGKPFLSGTRENFVGISHFFNGFCFFISNKKYVGIDIECKHRLKADELRDRWHPIISSHDLVKTEFFICWTLKEAVLKSMSIGLAVRMSDVIIVSCANNEYILVYKNIFFTGKVIIEGARVISLTYKNIYRNPTIKEG